MSKVYVSGPMTGYPDFNFPAFDSVAAQLREEGHEWVFSPADHDREVVEKLWPGKSPSDFPGYAEGDLSGYFDAVSSGGVFTLDNMLLADINFIANEADWLVCLPGWEKSTGSRYERTVAEALNKQVLFAEWHAGDAGWAWVPDPEQKQLTEYLRRFGQATEVVEDSVRDYAAPGTPDDLPQLGLASVRELLAELRIRLGLSPSIAHDLSRIESQLA